MISPTGRIVASLPIHVQDSLVVTVPMLESRTLYSRTGNVFSAACAVGLVMLVRRSRVRLGDEAC